MLKNEREGEKFFLRKNVLKLLMLFHCTKIQKLYLHYFHERKKVKRYIFMHYQNLMNNNEGVDH
jgi:hypothetical protein